MFRKDMYEQIFYSCKFMRCLSDAWPMFFFLLKKNWRKLGGEISRVYLNCESLQYKDKDIEIVPLNNPNASSWGKRLLKCLEKIDDEFVLMMCEDFYYEDVIKTEIIDKCVDYMLADKSILNFQFIPTAEVYDDNEKFQKADYKYPGFALRKKFGYFRLSAVPSLWRKSGLMRFTGKNDNPWDWEFFGSLRTWLNKNKVYCWTSLTDCIFKYDVEHGGAIHRGKWVGYKMEELTKKYNYHLDYGTREVEYDWIKNGSFFKVPPFYKRLKSIFRNRSKFIFEIFRGLWL